MSEKKEVDENTLLQLLEMYYEDGMKETEIAESFGLTLLQVHQVLADWENGEYKTR
jgi:DNA-binding transcriptional regulator LsrR (DeoR family)